MRLFRKLINTIKEGIKGIWIHRNLGMVSITSTFFTLFIIGIIIIITVSINSFALQIQNRVNDVEVFIKNDATQLQIENLEAEIYGVDIEKTVEFRSSEEALEVMRDSWGENADLLDDVEYEGLLPASYIIRLEDITNADQFVETVKNNEAVDEVNYYRELVNQISKLSAYVKIFGTLLIVVLMVVSLFIIANTIKLTVISRVKEISVMKNVGATNNYIRIPFVIEGLFYSILASVLAFLAIYYAYSFIYTNFGLRITENFEIFNLIRPELFRFSLLQIFLALGLGIGVLGSTISIRRYLLDEEVTYAKQV